MVRNSEGGIYSTDSVKLGRSKQHDFPQIQPDRGEADSMIQTDRRVRKTKKAIQDAYFRLLEKKRTEKITVAEITREADIDRKTFYLHYTLSRT